MKHKSADIPVIVTVMTKDWRSRPELNPPVFGGIVVEGIEDLAEIVAASA